MAELRDLKGWEQASLRHAASACDSFESEAVEALQAYLSLEEPKSGALPIIRVITKNAFS